MDDLHPADKARLLMDAEWEGKRRKVPAGSAEEAQIIEQIDERRREEQEGLMRGHPDVPGLAYRRSADSADLTRRRLAARRHWRAAARRGRT